MNILKLFNAVIAKETNETMPFISEDGFIIEPKALWAKSEILEFFQKEKLNGNDLNKTFHKSWAKVKNSTRHELFIEQISHYISTYGSNFQDEIYIPNEIINIPEIKLKYKVIKAYSVSEMTNKCLSLLKSGIALKEETVNKLITILVDELDYTFTGNEGIKNKEAIVMIAETYGVYPDNPVEFFRYVIYRTTNTTLLIKNNELIDLIEESSYNPTQIFKKFGLSKLAEIFNRFKPLFLAYKNKCPKTINKISKLSKKCHKPLISNPLNEVTQRKLSDEDINWLNEATIFALFKALNACYNRKSGQDSFVYRIRNGKSWVKQNGIKESINDIKRLDDASVFALSKALNSNYSRKKGQDSSVDQLRKHFVKQNDIRKSIIKSNYDFLLEYLKKRYTLEGLKVFIPKDIKYSLPTSEKMFVGNVPTGTKFYGKKLAVGIYWENSWGARDLDLSGINIGGKIGWNASYNQNNGDLMYSGDITDAPNGAVEYLYANKWLNIPTLVQNSVYSGDKETDYKIILGEGDKITKDYMMNPNNLFAEIKCKSVQEQTILGMLIAENDKQCFVLLNFGAGHSRVSGNSEISDIATKALYQQWKKPLSFKKIIKLLGASIIKSKEESDIDLSLENLDKDSFVKIFSNEVRMNIRIEDQEAT